MVIVVEMTTYQKYRNRNLEGQFPKIRFSKARSTFLKMGENWAKNLKQKKFFFLNWENLALRADYGLILKLSARRTWFYLSQLPTSNHHMKFSNNF